MTINKMRESGEFVNLFLFFIFYCLNLKTQRNNHSVSLGRWRRSVGLRTRRCLVLGRNRQLGRGMRSARCTRRLRQGGLLPRLDQTDD